MVSNQQIAAAAKESSRTVSSVFLSLLLPLSFLLLARSIHPQIIIFSTLTLLLFPITAAALAHRSTGTNPALLVSERRRLCAGWVVLFLTQCCLVMGVSGTVEISSYRTAEGNLALTRRLFFALGLHDTMMFWLANVVRPVVDVTIGEGCVGWTEKVLLAAAFGNLWWRRLREEAEALVLLPRDGVAGFLGRWLYYLTAAVGAVAVGNGFFRAVLWLFRRRPIKVVDNIDMDCVLNTGC